MCNRKRQEGAIIGIKLTLYKIWSKTTSLQAIIAGSRTLPELSGKTTFGGTLGLHQHESGKNCPLLTLNTCSFCSNHSFSALGSLGLIVFSLSSLFMSITTKSKNSKVNPYPLDFDFHITLLPFPIASNFLKPPAS